MTKHYKKSKIWFSIVWIVSYVVLASVGDSASEEIGISKIITLPRLIALSTALFFFVKKTA